MLVECDAELLSESETVCLSSVDLRVDLAKSGVEVIQLGSSSRNSRLNILYICLLLVDRKRGSLLGLHYLFKALSVEIDIVLGFLAVSSRLPDDFEQVGNRLRNLGLLVEEIGYIHIVVRHCP